VGIGPGCSTAHARIVPAATGRTVPAR
jgi:hypothetical protein